jgi:glycosyltransferase involved in cell wall biosynthesis
MSETGPKILAVVGPCPFAKAHGAQVRVKNTLDLLKRCGRLSLVMASMAEHDAEAVRRTAEVYDLKGAFRLEAWPLDFAGRWQRELNARHLNTHGFRMKPGDKARVLELAKDADLVWFHNVRVANALEVYRLDRPTVLDADDLMSRFHASALGQGGWKDNILESKRSWQWRRREDLFLERFDVVCVCSEGDKAYLGGSDRIEVVPNGFDQSLGPLDRKRTGAPTIGFVGSLKYPANRDGVLWFLKEVWPIIRQKVPQACFRVAGEGSFELATKFGDEVTGIGWVEDIEAEMARWWLTIVPVHVGGGTRVKIATAFSFGCPVVSTTWGAYGYEVSNGREILLSDAPDAFADDCRRILEDERFANELARNAAEAFNRNWTWEAIAPRVRRVIELAVEKGRVRLAKTPERTGTDGQPDSTTERHS